MGKREDENMRTLMTLIKRMITDIDLCGSV